MDRNDLDWKTQQLEIMERQLQHVRGWLVRLDPLDVSDEDTICEAIWHCDSLRRRLAWLQARGYQMEL